MAKPIPLVSVQVLDFYQLAQTSDAAVIRRLEDLLQRSAKPLLPATIRYNACRVMRSAESVAVQLLWSEQPAPLKSKQGEGAKAAPPASPALPAEVARIAFIPPRIPMAPPRKRS